MPPTGIQFIDGLRQEWSEGSLTQGDALDRLLPWEDDAAARTQNELEAAWTLRQELETGKHDLFQPEHILDTNGVRSTNGSSAPPTPPHSDEGVASSPDADEIRHMVADLRANPLISRDDLLAAHAICSRLVERGVASDSSTSTLCAEVEEKVARYIETSYSVIDKASHVFQDTPGMEEKLGACNTIRDNLADIDALRPGDPTLPDMIAWCEQTRRELGGLLAERDLVSADVACLSVSGTMDTGLVESSKQRLINLSDMQLSKDDLGFRRIARELAIFLTTYLASKLQPGATHSSETLSEYRRVLHLAKQAPEAIGAEEAKRWDERLTAAQAEWTHSRGESEPPAQTATRTPLPPPQPRSTSVSQPDTNSLQDGAPLQLNPAVATTPVPRSEPGYHSTLAPPPPPRVQPGWGSTSTQPTPPVPGYGTMGQGGPNTGIGTGMTNVSPSQTNTTINVSPYSQLAPIYAPNQPRQGLPQAAWAGIAVGVAAVLILIIILVAVLASQGKPGVNTKPVNGGGAGSRDVAFSFYQNLQAHNYQAAFDLLGPPFSEQTDVNTLRGNVVVVENREGSMQTIDVSNVNETGDTAQATVAVNYTKGNHSVDSVSMSKQANRWLITSIKETGQ